MLDIPPNSIAHTEGFTVLKENTLITNFQPHFHRGKARQRFCRTVTQVVHVGTQLQLDDELHLRRRRRAGAPKGTVIQVSVHDSRRPTRATRIRAVVATATGRSTGTPG
jgi:hypothetical protein